MNLHEHDLFTPWTDPQSGIVSYLLQASIAPHQQSFYFVNSSMATGGRHVWFYTAFPPSANHTLGVADLETGEMHHFPETQFSDGSPLIDPETGEIYWVSGLDIWKRSPDPAASPVRINSFPEDLAKRRIPRRIATHLTLSADRRVVNIDAQIGNEWFVGAAPLDGSPVEIWQQFDRCYNHAQFSPTDPDLLLMAQDWWIDANTGEHHKYVDRLWTIRRGEEARPLVPDAPSGRRSHEWWQADGSHVWYVDYDLGTEKLELATGKRTNVWPGGTCHSYCDATGTLIAGDIGTYSWGRTGCRVAFFNTTTGREISIASDLPEPVPGRMPYHLDPHPRFCLDDQYICYTTTVRGHADLAVVPVASLVEATS